MNRISAIRKRGLASSIADYYAWQRMRAAAANLPPVPDKGGAPVEVHFLTGRRFWHQTLLCAWTLAAQVDVAIRPVIYDDGSLTARDIAHIRRVFPQARCLTSAEVERRLDMALPRDVFPQLRARRDAYPHLRKLTDVHAGQRGWKMVLDSDMLFFRRPDQLLHWLSHPTRPCHMVDTATAYGYPLEFLSQQCGHPVAERINVGATGLCSDQVHWTALELWLAEQIRIHGPSYYQEQALVAQIMAGQPCEVLSEFDYWVLPPNGEIRKPRAVLHHYVAEAKELYLHTAWETALQVAGKA